MSELTQNDLEHKILTIVVGAGASKEVNMPLGSELKKQISDLLDLKYDGYTQYSGDNIIGRSLGLLGTDKLGSKANINLLVQASRHIRDAMPLAISIDNFIDAHKGNLNIENAGKLAIVRSILQAEAKSSLTIAAGNHHNKMNFEKSQETWLNSFFQIITENCTFDALPKRLKKIGIICFNYDRCIEHYLFHSLKNYYGVNDEEAKEMLLNLDIYHPYGSVGNLPWMETDFSVGFGEEPSPQLLIELAKRIRTFTEEIAQEDISKIQQLLYSAKRVAFLGFAFHSLNLRLLYQKPDQTKNKICHVYATGIGISEHDALTLKDELTLMAGYNRDYIKISRDTPCAKLFAEYRRTLSFR